MPWPAEEGCARAEGSVVLGSFGQKHPRGHDHAAGHRRPTPCIAAGHRRQPLRPVTTQPLHFGREQAVDFGRKENIDFGFSRKGGDVVIRIGIGYKIPRVNRKSPRVLVRHSVPQGIGNGASAICRLLLNLLLPEAGRGSGGKVSALSLLPAGDKLGERACFARLSCSGFTQLCISA
jgi:hypothetical protein